MSREILEENWRTVSKPLTEQERERVLRHSTREARQDRREAQAKSAKWIAGASEVSKDWRMKAIEEPVSDRALNKAMYLVYRAMEHTHDPIAVVRLYQIANGRRKYIDGFMTRRWRNEIARAQEWKKKIRERETVKV